MIEIVKKAWCKEAERGLAIALGNDQAEIKRQVETGEAELWLMPAHGWLVTRIEHPAGQSPEMVLVAGEGRDLGRVVSAFRQIAQANSIASMRAHCARPGLGKMLSHHGFTVAETVYRAQVV